ncbi:MAG: sigma-54 dependent transcriptional regulator [Deltaproteobacteria bacterium]|nr:sigma-54 dependent transcriptional regulator [Deltaproteobacteria bacterium]
MHKLENAKILVVDDEPDARLAVAEVLATVGFTVETAGDAFKALGKAADFAPDVVVTDLRMPGMDGFELMARLRATPSPPAFVLLTGVNDVATAVKAIRDGAADYLVKPIQAAPLIAVVREQVEHRRVLAQLEALRSRPEQRRIVHGMIGQSEPMARIHEAIARVAPARSSVLITGESGTGKELVAEAIHANSPRAAGPFIKVHCAALAETLLESELFGHERGAFTGAVAQREGRFAAADKGTLFLDEIGEISLSIQVKLLRFLQEREFERVGGDRPQRVDVRIIAATHRDLPAMVRDRTFREDLFYRLNVVTIDMPPLRDRPDDIPALAQFFFERSRVENGRQLTELSPETIAALTAYPWPGNVRELQHAIERAVVMSRGPAVEVADLPPPLQAHHEPREPAIAIPGSSLRAIERHAVLKTLEAAKGSTSKAAAILEVTPRTIQYKLHEYLPAKKTGVPSIARATEDALPGVPSADPSPT